MAQPIHCDGPGDQHPADVMLSMLVDGTTMAWCMTHYVDAARMLVEMTDAPGPDDQAAEDAALARLETVQAPGVAESMPVDDEAAAAAIVAGLDSTEPAHVVPRGRSASRAAYEARQRADAAEAADTLSPEAEGAPGPSGEPVGDPDGSPAPV